MMDGTAELLELARLLRLGAVAGRKVSAMRPPADRARIEALAVQAEEMAEALEDIAVPPGIAAVPVEKH